jgi:putative hydrolase of the HAD superfamily
VELTIPQRSCRDRTSARAVNIVFDLGGVLVEYDRQGLIAELYPDSATQASVRAALIDHPDWVEMDRGALSEVEAITRAAARSTLPETEFARFIERLSVAWRPIPGTVELLYRLRARGYAIFCLSNMHPASMAFLERAFSFWDVFTGTVISCRVGLCKPDRDIDDHLLQRYALAAVETFFIDDLESNLTAARSLGINTIRFEDPEQCARALRSFGLE